MSLFGGPPKCALPFCLMFKGTEKQKGTLEDDHPYVHQAFCRIILAFLLSHCGPYFAARPPEPWTCRPISDPILGLVQRETKGDAAFLRGASAKTCWFSKETARVVDRGHSLIPTDQKAKYLGKARRQGHKRSWDAMVRPLRLIAGLEAMPEWHTAPGANDRLPHQNVAKWLHQFVSKTFQSASSAPQLIAPKPAPLRILTETLMTIPTPFK